MFILVLNSGSSSIKYKLFDISGKGERLLDKGVVERIGHKVPSHREALAMILDKLRTRIDAVGHRVVHGGKFKEAAIVNKEVIKEISRFSEVAPLHNPAAIMTITESMKLISGIPHVSVFDTAFYQTMPEHAYLYAIPYRYHEKYRIRKYGFHGTSHRYVTMQAARILKKSINNVNLVTCHLGNGCSITAVENGKAIDTSMGFTPLEGLIMGTRSGDIDPAIIPYIMEKENIDINAVMKMLNKKSGLLGISGISNDMREIIKAARSSKKARLALDMFIYRIKKYIGAYVGILKKVDAVVFTGGIGENYAGLMKKTCKGVVPKNSKILIIPTDEELMIARDTYNLVS
ncbi:MAG: acetate kinase [Candidatus Omnitrophica bacterium]|nr:acetate kinase [Candidatus Omnitrophota bacterium]